MQYTRKHVSAIAFLAVAVMVFASFAVFAAEDSNAENTITKATKDASGNTLEDTYITSSIVTVGVGTLRWTSYFGHASEVVCIDAGDANAASWNGKAYRSLFTFDQKSLIAKMSGGYIDPSEDDLKTLGMAAHDHNGFSTSNLEAIKTWNSVPTLMIISESVYSGMSDELKAGISLLMDVVVIKEVDAFFGEDYALSEGFTQNLSILATVFNDETRANQLANNVASIVKDIQGLVSGKTPIFKKAFIAAASQSGSKDLTWSVGSYCPFDLAGLKNSYSGSSTVATNGGSEVMSSATPDVIFADLSGTAKYYSDNSQPVLVYAASNNLSVMPLLPYFWFGYNFDNALADAYLLVYYSYSGALSYAACMDKIASVYEAFYPELSSGSTVIDEFANYYGNTGSKAFIGNEYVVNSSKKLEIKTPAPTTTYSVTDGRGNTVTFESVPSKVVSVGVGLNATMVQVGALDKIVVADSYTATSASYNFEVLKDLRQYCKDGKIRASGNIYNSGKASLIADIIAVTDDGKFDKTKDVIIITGSDTYVPGIVDTLKGYGFTKILTWKDITDYSDIADFVDAVSLAVTGDVCSDTAKMRSLAEVIKTQIGETDKAEGLFVTYSSSTFKVGNTGSLANSMILAAGGISITVDSSITSSTYAANITDLVEKHPGVVIFIDNTIASNDAVRSQFDELIKGSGVKVIALSPLWNNYSLESMEGVRTMAETMYPDIFADGKVVPGDKAIIIEGNDKVIILPDELETTGIDTISVALSDATVRLPVSALGKIDSAAFSLSASVKEEKDATIAEKIGKKILGENVTKVTVDLTNATTTKDLGKVAVVVPYVKQNADSNIVAYCITDSGAEKLETSFNGTVATFNTTHLSDFVIVEVEKDPTVEPETTHYMLIIVAVLVIIGAGALVISSKRKN